MARDGGELADRPGALMRPRDRRGDMRSMDRPREPRVLLMRLSERTSGKGNAYLSGWPGKARLVGFRGEDDEHGNPVWDIYAAEPAPRPARAGGHPGSRSARELEG